MNHGQFKYGETPEISIKESIIRAGKYSVVTFGMMVCGGVMVHSVECVVHPKGETRGAAYCAHTESQPRIPDFPTKSSLTNATTIAPPSGVLYGNVTPVYVDSEELLRERSRDVVFRIDTGTPDDTTEWVIIRQKK